MANGECTMTNRKCDVSGRGLLYYIRLSVCLLFTSLPAIVSERPNESPLPSNHDSTWTRSNYRGRKKGECACDPGVDNHQSVYDVFSKTAFDYGNDRIKCRQCTWRNRTDKEIQEDPCYPLASFSSNGTNYLEGRKPYIKSVKCQHNATVIPQLIDWTGERGTVARRIPDDMTCICACITRNFTHDDLIHLKEDDYKLDCWFDPCKIIDNKTNALKWNCKRNLEDCVEVDENGEKIDNSSSIFTDSDWTSVEQMTRQKDRKFECKRIDRTPNCRASQVKLVNTTCVKDPCRTDSGGNYCQKEKFCNRNLTTGEAICKCEDPYEGKHCETRNPCKKDPENPQAGDYCGNGGKCELVNNKAECKCPPSHHGPKCEHELKCKRCVNTKISNSCKDNPDGSYDCGECALGWDKKNCDYLNPCTQQNSTKCNAVNCPTCCQVDKDQSTKTKAGSKLVYTYKVNCNCDGKGFHGKECEFPNLCKTSKNRCRNPGKCLEVDKEDEVKCDCEPGFTGKYCQREDVCITTYRAGCRHGKCNPFESKLERKLVCDCDDGYYQANETGPCVPNPCKMRGTNVDIPCINGGFLRETKDSPPGCECVCNGPFHGASCEFKDACRAYPCGPTTIGKCVNVKNGFKCECSAGYHGPNCQYEDLCAEDRENPCENGGICVTGKKEDFTCKCPPGFLPPKCEERDPCHVNPCLNNGRCIRKDDSYTCECPPKSQFDGVNCDELNRCKIPRGTCGDQPGSRINNNNCYPCQKGGTCVADKTILPYSYSCNCQSKFIGEECQYNRGKFRFRHPSEMQVGMDSLFVIVVFEEGDDLHVRIDLGNKFTFMLYNTNLFAVTDTEDIKDKKLLNVLGDYEPGTKYFAFHHRYRVKGDFAVNATIYNGDSKNSIQAGRSLQWIKVKAGGGCLPSVELQNCGYDSRDIPRYRRTVRFVIPASLGLPNTNSCLSVERFTHVWSLYEITSLHPFPNEKNVLEHFQQITGKKANESRVVEFKPSSLKVGSYWLEIEFFPDSDTSNTSRKYGIVDYCYFDIVPGPLNPVIAGGETRTIDPSEGPFTLDASDSTDPSYMEKSDYLEHEWTFDGSRPCSEVSSSRCDASVIKIDPADLTKDEYIFRVRVRNPENGRIAYATQKVLIRRNSIQIQVNCLKSCGLDGVFSRTSRILLQCTTSPERELTYTGELDHKLGDLEQPNTGVFIVQLKNQAITNEPVFTCKGEDTQTNRKGSSSFRIVMNPPMTIGTCTMEPKVGNYLEPVFSIKCVGFKSENSPLVYIVYAKPIGWKMDLLKKGLLMFHDTTPVMLDLSYPIGHEDNHWDVEILIEVMDSRGDLYQIPKIVVQVQPPSNFTNQTIAEQLFKPMGNGSVFNTSELGGSLLRRIRGGDHQRALQLMLNLLYFPMSSPPSLVHHWNEEAKFLDIMAVALVKIPRHSPLLVMQMNQAVHLILRNNVSDRALNASAGVLAFTAEDFSDFVEFKQDVINTDDITQFSRVSKASARILLTEGSRRGMQKVLERKQGAKLDEKDVEFLDDQDYVDREYFGDDHDDILEHGTGDKIAELVNRELDEDIQMFSKIAQFAYYSVEEVLDATADRQMISDRVDFISENETELSASVQVVGAKDIPGKSFVNAKVKFILPSNAVLPSEYSGKSKPIQVEMRETDDHVNPFFDDPHIIVKTPVASIVLKDQDLNELKLEFGRDTLIDIFLPFENASGAHSQVGTQLVNVPLIQFSEIDQSNKAVRIFHLSVTPGSKFVVSITTVGQTGIEYIVTAVKDVLPEKWHFCSTGNMTQILNDAKTNHEFDAGRLEDLDDSVENLIDFYVGVWPRDPDDIGFGMFNISYKIAFSQQSCFILNEGVDEWNPRGCEIGDLGNSTHLHCRCRHMSIFAGSIFVPPNNLDVVEDFLLIFDFDVNKIVPITVACILAFYVLLLLRSLWKDADDHQKHSGITIMAEIGEDANYTYYFITVYTGSRPFAGTSANVSIQLYGANGRSETYVLKDHTLSVFNRGGIDSFLISSVKDLGELDRIRVWHDHAGTGPDWYLRKIIVKNVKTEKQWYFFIGKWLSMSVEHDAAILREVHVSTEKEAMKWSRRFRERLVESFNNSHLWLSVFLRLPSSRFTRAQRVSCAVAILTSYMLINIMFYGTPLLDYRDMIEVGDFAINAATIMLSIQTALCATPFGIILVTCFQRIRQRRIPTLIIWKNGNQRRWKQGFKDVYNRTQLIPVKRIEEDSIPFSIPETDMKDTERWIMSITPYLPKEPIPSHLPLPDICVRRVGGSGDGGRQAEAKRLANDLLRTGRRPMIESFRNVDPSSFVYSGNNNMKRVEELIDDEILRRAQEDRDWMRNLRVPTGHGDQEEIPPFLKPIRIVDDSSKPASVNYEDPVHVGIALELFEMPPVEKKWLYFPWWWIYVAWTLCIFTILITSFFTILYGLRYGYLKSLHWLSGISLSFLQSLLIMQPLQIFLVAFIITLIFRKMYSTEEDRFQVRLLEGDEDIGNPKPLEVAIFRPTRSYPPLSGYETFKLRMSARRRNAMLAGLTSICFHILLMIFIIIIAQSQQSKNSFMVTDHLKNMLQLHEDVEDCKDDHCDSTFAELRTEAELYAYLSDVFLEIVNPRTRYDGTNFKVLTKADVVMLKDEVNILIGVPRIRQVRLQKESCGIHKRIKELLVGSDISREDIAMYPDTFNCTGHFHAEGEERDTFNPYWKEVEGTRSWTGTNDVWKWKDDNTTGAVGRGGVIGTYGGGGYVAELGTRYQRSANVIAYLEKRDWIDGRTRAVFIEFLIYNPNVNLFADVVLIVEKSPSQALRTSSKVTTLQLNPPDEQDPLPLILCHVFVLIFLIILIFLYLKSLVYHWRHYGIRGIFTRFWLWSDLAQILFTGSALYIAIEHAMLLSEFRTRFEGRVLNEFISFQPLAMSSVKLRNAFAAATCLCVIKFWKLLVYTFVRFYIMSLTLRLTARFLVAFVLLLVILTSAFALWGYLAFGPVYVEFSSLRDSFMELIHQLLSVTFYDDLYASNRVLGPAYFFLFGFFVCCIGLNLVIALLNQGLLEAKEIARQRPTWTTYFNLFQHYYYRVFPRPYRTDPHNKLAIHPVVVRQMRECTADFIRKCLATTEMKRMKEMKVATDRFLSGSGFCVISKQKKRQHLLEEIQNRVHVNEEKMNRMRLSTIEFIRRVAEMDFLANDYRVYAEYRMEILRLRLKKIHDKANLIIIKIEEHKRQRLLREEQLQQQKPTAYSWRTEYPRRR